MAQKDEDPDLKIQILLKKSFVIPHTDILTHFPSSLLDLTKALWLRSFGT
jgi:hypothetical protein